MRMAAVITASSLVCAMEVAPMARAAPRTHTVVIESMRFEPDALTIARGDTIVWRNRDVVPHTATAKSGNFDSKVIQAGASWKRTIRERGEYAYICTLHPTMNAIVHVE
jgi:plastocyanin